MPSKPFGVQLLLCEISIDCDCAPVSHGRKRLELETTSLDSVIDEYKSALDRLVVKPASDDVEGG